MYNRVNCSQKQYLTVRSYITGNNTSTLPKNHYGNIFSKKLVYKSHTWIEYHPHVILYPNVSDLIFVKINVNIVEKPHIIIQISIQELHNDMMLPIFQGDCFGAITVDGKVCIGDTSLRKYIPKYIKSTSNRNKNKSG